MVSKTSHILYVQTTGPDIPERAFSPFVLAMIARRMDINGTIYFSDLGAMLLKKGIAETIRNDENQTLKEIMDRAFRNDVKFKVSEDSVALLDIERSDLIPEAEIIGPIEVKELAFDVEATIWC